MNNNKLHFYRDFSKPRFNNKLIPWQVTGITDGEGGFFCNITQKSLVKLNVKLEYKVTQKSHSEGILYEIKDYFGCGNVVIDNRKSDTKKYHIVALSDILNKVIPHFEKYPCVTSKFLNFIDWKKIAFKMAEKEHFTKEGIIEIINIANNMNTKRSFEEKYNFFKESLLINSKCSKFLELSPYWIQTFLTGEGMFYNYIAEKRSRGKIYQGCDSSIEIAQNNHDVAVLLSIKNYFNGGYIKPKYNYYNIFECKNSFSVNRFIFRDTNTIIDFVEKYPMLTRKHLDYLDWKYIVELKNNGAHKTKEGLELMINIVSQMNSKRK